MPHTQPNFHNLGIEANILSMIDALKFTVPTPIQHKVIPSAIDGKDIIGIAQTGTGKTLAFGIPMVQRLGLNPGRRGLVLVPTRELALQVNDALSKITPAFKMRTTVVIGGASMHEQLVRLKQNPHIIIATPGRLNDHIEHQNLRLDSIGILVLDEADRMLDMGFLPQIERILRIIPRQRQTMLFSATIPPEIIRIASRHMQTPVRTEIAPSGTAAELVSQELFIVRHEMKGNLLNELLRQYAGSVLLFVRTKRSAVKVTRLLQTSGQSVAEIHADRSLAQRKEALRGFKAGQYRILVATDIAARGIDVTGIELVVNYDLPDDPENYVHRIGRTGRAGKEGRAVSFATPEQGQDVRRIEKIIRTTIPLSSHPNIPAEKFYVSHGVKTRSFRPSRRLWRRGTRLG